MAGSLPVRYWKVVMLIGSLSVCTMLKQSGLGEASLSHQERNAKHVHCEWARR